MVSCNEHLEVEGSNSLLVFFCYGDFIHYIGPLKSLRISPRVETISHLEGLTVETLVR